MILDFRHIPAVASDKVVWILYELSLTCDLGSVLLPFHWCGRRRAEVLSQQPSIKHLSKRRGLDRRPSVNIHYSQTQDTRQWQPGEKLDKTNEKERKPTRGISCLGGAVGTLLTNSFVEKTINLFSVCPWGAKDNSIHTLIENLKGCDIIVEMASAEITNTAKKGIWRTESCRDDANTSAFHRDSESWSWI